MNILIDTHVLIYREFNRAVQRYLQDVIHSINDLNYRLVVHPLSVSEVEKDENIPNKSILLSKIKTYSTFVSELNPYDDAPFFELIQKPKNERDKVDSYMLYCLYKKEVDFFLTEDSDIIEKASLLNISNRIMNLKDASVFFKKALKERKNKDDGKPVLCFYKQGTKWYIGEKGKESIFDGLKGFEFIHYLLGYPYKDLPAMTVYNLGKVSGNQDHRGEISSEEKDSHGLHKEAPIFNKRITIKDKELIKLKIDQLRGEIDSNAIDSDNPTFEDVVIENEKRNKTIEKLKKLLNEKSGRDYKSESAKARVNVTRLIKSSLLKIHEDKSISSIPRYLNESTIKTGDTCIYKPLVNDTPTWILYCEVNNK
jgi:hypothetical protein